MTPTKNVVTGAARRYTDAQLGGPTTDQDSSVICQTTAGIVLQGNPDRVGLLVLNLGNNDVYLALTSAAGTSFGSKLPANGGNFSCNVRDDFTLPSRTFYGLANGGTSALYFLEVIRLDYTPAGEQ